MDIYKETSNLVESATSDVCKGMTDSEKQAYLCGVKNTLSALHCMLETNFEGELIVNLFGIGTPKEMSIEQLGEAIL